MKKPFKICYIVSDVDRWVQFEWWAKSMQSYGFDISFILLNEKDSELESYLKSLKIEVLRIKKPKLILAPFFILKLSGALKKINASIVHTHFLWASVYGLTAAKWAGIQCRIQTRHHSDFHIKNHPKGVLYDRLNNSQASHIVTPTQIIKDLMIKKEAAKTNKISVIPHGFDFKEFLNLESSRIEHLKSKYNIKENMFVVGAVSRFIKPKSVPLIISAFQKFYNEHPESVLFLANARGPEKKIIDAELKNLPKESYRLVGFEKDLFSLFRLFKIFIHIPSRSTAESFGQVYIESLASGVASIFTRAGIATEHFTDQQEALIVPAGSKKHILESMFWIYNNFDDAQEMAKRGQNYVLQEFSFEKMIQAYIDLYNSLNTQ